MMTSTPRMSKSMISAGTMASTNPVEESMSTQFPTVFFPFKLTATLSALKIVCGSVLVGLGAAAIIQNAGMAWKGAGIAGGVVVIISGVLGAYAVRTGAIRPYVISFLFSCLCSLLASVVVIIFSSTGLAEDASAPYGVKQDKDGNYISDLVAPSREAAMLINTVLIIVSFLDIIFSLPSIIITLRELCHCYDPSLLTHKPGQVRADWLMSWLGQQPGAPVLYSHASGVPYNKMGPGPGSPYRPLMTRATPPFIQIPSDHSQPGSRHSPKDAPHPSRSRTRSKSPNPRQVHAVNHHQTHPRAKSSRHPPQAQAGYGPPHYHHHPHHHLAPVHGPMLHPAAHYPSYPPLELFAPMYPPSHPHIIPIPHPMAVPGQWVWPGEWAGDWAEHQIYPAPERHSSPSREDRRHRHQRDKDQRKRSRSKSQPKESHKRKKVRAGKGPTDSDIEKTYTGMDRDLAEEFIEQTMEPNGAGAGDQTVSGTESEAW